MKKLVALVLAVAMLLSMASFALADTAPINEVNLGDNTDLTATVHFVYHRTDLPDKLAGYVEEFNKIYPNITVEYELVTDFAENALLRIGSNDWTIMGIPTVDKDELSKYYIPLGTLADLDEIYNFMTAWEYDGNVYGMPSTGNANGIVYNKAVFEAAGVTELPKTPDEFIAALQAIKDNTDAIPLYTNYAAGWTMGAWDDYIWGSATGDGAYLNQVILHTANPFTENNGTGPYAVYKILYDAVANGLIEDDYTTTDWEGCKGMINQGKIGCMVLGSWAYVQMVDAGPNGDDIGYMNFPITVDGAQYASAGPDYCFGINVQASAEEQQAAMIYLKWLTHESGFAYSEGGVPIVKGDPTPALYDAFADITLVSGISALPGEETLLNDLNSESELNLNAGGNTKIQEIVEHAFNGTKSFDDIMADWNEAWSDAQETYSVEIW